MYDDETGLYYLNSRFYSAETARFLQEDSYRGNIGDPLSLNLYAYVSYNPLVYYDPTGHWMEGDDKLPQEARDKIAQYTAVWEKHNAIYNDPSNSATKRAVAKAVMEAAHDAAEAVRKQYASQAPTTPTSTLDPKPTDKPVSNGNTSSNGSGSSQGSTSSSDSTGAYPPTQQPAEGNKENATLPTQPTPGMQQITMTINDVNPTGTEKDVVWDTSESDLDKTPKVGEVITIMVAGLAAGALTIVTIVGDGITPLAELVSKNMSKIKDSLEEPISNLWNRTVNGFNIIVDSAEKAVDYIADSAKSAWNYLLDTFSPSHSNGNISTGTEKTLPGDFLNDALMQQGLTTAPNGLKQTWTENGYKYEVRVHAGESQYTNAQSIYRVSRQQIPTPGTQGTGTYYLGSDGNWHHTSVLKEYLGNGQLNPIYDANAAKITHIPLP